MGQKLDKETNGVNDWELHILVSSIVLIFNEVVNKRRSVSDATNAIISRLRDYSRYSLVPKRSPNPDNLYFPGGKLQLVISEKYYDRDGYHAWALTLEISSSTRSCKVLYGVPISRSQSRAPSETASINKKDSLSFQQRGETREPGKEKGSRRDSNSLPRNTSNALPKAGRTSMIQQDIVEAVSPNMSRQIPRGTSSGTQQRLTILDDMVNPTYQMPYYSGNVNVSGISQGQLPVDPLQSSLTELYLASNY